MESKGFEISCIKKGMLQANFRFPLLIEFFILSLPLFSMLSLAPLMKGVTTPDICPEQFLINDVLKVLIRGGVMKQGGLKDARARIIATGEGGGD